MSSTIDEKLALYSANPTKDSVTEIIDFLQSLITVESEKTAENLNKLGYFLLELYSYTGVEADINSGISTLQEALKFAYDDDTEIKLKVYSNLGDAYQKRLELNISTEDLDEYVSARRKVVQLVPALDRSIADALMDLSDALRMRHEEFSIEADLMEAASVQRLAVLVLQEDSSLSIEQMDVADILASLLENQFLKTRNWCALDEAIIWNAKIAQSQCDSDLQLYEDFPVQAHSLSSCLLDRYKIYHLWEDLQNAINWAKKAVFRLCDSDEDYSKMAYQLAICLQYEWDRTEDLEILDEEIYWYKESLKGLDVGSAASNHRNNLLGVTLCQRGEISKSAADIESAAEHVRTARENSQPGSDEQVRAFNNLSNIFGSAVAIKCKLTPTAVEDAVEAAEHAVDLRPNSEIAAYNLCKAKILQYEQSGDREALDRYFELVSEQDLRSPRNSALLGIALIHKFHASGDLEVLDAAVEASRDSIPAGRVDSSVLSKRLTTLGNALALRAQWKGTRGDAINDISSSIQHLQHASRILERRRGDDKSTSRVEKPAGYDGNLAYALMTRYDILGSKSDIDEAIRVFKEAVQSAESSETDSLSAQHSNLASAYIRKFLSTKKRKYIDLAVVHGECSLNSASEMDPRFHVRCNNLAMSLRCRFETGLSDSMIEDITRAIELLERASKLAGDGCNSYPGYLNNTGLTRLSKMEILGDEDGMGIEKAIQEFTAALALAKHTSPLFSGIALNLARAWRKKYEQEDSNSEFDLRKAIGYAESAVRSPVANLQIRITAGYLGGIWTAQISRSSKDREQAAQLLREAASLIPLLSPRDMAIKDGIRNLAVFTAMDITVDAVAALMDADFPCGEALQLLDSNKEVIVGNLMECRYDLSSLEDSYPNLASRFKALQDAYHQVWELANLSPFIETSGYVKNATATDAMDPYHLRLSRIEKQIQDILTEIRSHDNFKSFLLPADSTEKLFKDCFKHDYIISINASQIRSDAIILHDGLVSTLHLQDLDFDELCNRDSVFRDALDEQSTDPVTARNELVDIMDWLWDVCGKAIVTNISDRAGSLRIVKPRVLWILGGVLGRLPLHACGKYSEIADGQYEFRDGMQNYVVSSYIPTIKSLEYARQRDAQIQKDGVIRQNLIVGATLVGMEGETPLLAAEVEINTVKTLLGDEENSQMLLNPTFSEVVKALPTSSLSHFACHGIADPKTPMESFLKLPDYKTNPLNVRTLMGLNLNCGLVYLSACETASSKRAELVDESLHLVSGFLLAGCARVVGTLWKIPDEAAVRVAKTFYSRLPWNHDGRRGYESSVYVLHEAISELKEMNDPLVSAAFVYYGL